MSVYGLTYEPDVLTVEQERTRYWHGWMGPRRNGSV